MLQQVRIINGQKVLVPLSGSTPTNEVTSGNMHPVTSNAVAQCSSYSTDEVFTGSYWIDGKKIYRNTFKLTSNLSNGDTVTISNIETIIKQEGNFTAPWGGSNTHIFPQSQGNTYFFFDAIIQTNKIQLVAKWNGNNSYIGVGSEIVFYYTKTTDTATRSIPTEETRSIEEPTEETR